MQRITISNKLALSLRFAALPAFALLPFFVTKVTGASCFSGVKLPDGTVAMGMALHGYPKYLSGLLMVAALCFIIFSFVQLTSRTYRQRYAQARQQFAVATISAIATVAAYVPLYFYSQTHYPPNWYCDGGDNTLHGGLSPLAHFGIGPTPVFMAAIVAVYLAAPLTALFVTRPRSRKLWLGD